jgi:hypothetical protein
LEIFFQSERVEFFFSFICFFRTGSDSINNYNFPDYYYAETSEFNISSTTEVLIGNGISTTLNLTVSTNYLIYLNDYAVIKISNLSILYSGNEYLYYPSVGIFKTDTSPANNSKIYLNSLKVQNLGSSLCFIFIVCFSFF